MQQTMSRVTDGDSSRPQTNINHKPMASMSTPLASPVASSRPKGLPPALGWTYCTKPGSTSPTTPIKRLPPGLPIPNHPRNGSILPALTPRSAKTFLERSSPVQQRSSPDPEKPKFHQRSPSKHILDSVAQIDSHFGAFQAGIDRLENSLEGFKRETMVEVVGLRKELLEVRKEIWEVIKGVQREQQNGAADV